MDCLKSYLVALRVRWPDYWTAWRICPYAAGSHGDYQLPDFDAEYLKPVFQSLPSRKRRDNQLRGPRQNICAQIIVSNFSRLNLIRTWIVIKPHLLCGNLSVIDTHVTRKERSEPGIVLSIVWHQQILAWVQTRYVWSRIACVNNMPSFALFLSIRKCSALFLTSSGVSFRWSFANWLWLMHHDSHGAFFRQSQYACLSCRNASIIRTKWRPSFDTADLALSLLQCWLNWARSNYVRIFVHYLLVGLSFMAKACEEGVSK